MNEEFEIVGCIGCQACISVSPNSFEMDRSGSAKIKGTADKQGILDAIQECPISAIRRKKI